MAMGGMEMMLKSIGVDPKKIIADFEALRTGVTKTLDQLNERLTAIEKTQNEIREAITLWMKKQPEPNQVQSQPQPLPVQQQPPNPSPSSPPLTLLTRLQPQNQPPKISNE